MRRKMILVPLALSAALLTGCASGAMSAGDSSAIGPLAQQQYASDSNLQSGGSAEALIGGDPATWGPDAEKAMSAAGQQIITTVDLTVTVTTPSSAADAASDIASKLGGNVSYRSETSATDDYPGSAQLTLRIPSAQLTQALDELKELGVARDTSINAMDVTTESRDLDARITSLQTSVDRLLTLMAQATSTENLLAVESALSQRQAELESLQSQKRYLDDQVQLSTVNLYLQSEASAPAPNPDNFWTGLVTGWNAFVGFWAGVLVALGVLVPWLAAAGLITLVVLLWVKRARRRRAAAKATAADAATTSVAPEAVTPTKPATPKRAPAKSDKA